MEECNTLLENTRANLDDRLANLDDHLANLVDRLEWVDDMQEPSPGENLDKYSGTDASLVAQIREERQSTENSLQICAELSHHINQVQIANMREKRSLPGTSTSKSTSLSARMTNDSLQECKDSLAYLAAKLANHEKQLSHKLMSSMEGTSDTPDIAPDIAELRDELKSTRQCMNMILSPSRQLEDKVYDESDVESVFSTASLSSSVSSRADLVSTAVLEWARLLLNDEVMGRLYPLAIFKVGEERFTRNFSRFLKGYSRGLSHEVSNEIQRQAMFFARHSANQTAMLVTRALKPEHAALAVDMAKFQQINEWLESRNTDTDRAEETIHDEADQSDINSEASGTDGPRFNSLEEVKEFMISAKAFISLRNELRSWLKVDEKEVEETQGSEIAERAEKSLSEQAQNTNYDILFSRGYIALIQNYVKHAVNNLAGQELSWWPLSQPEEYLKDGYTRVYSIPCVGSIHTSYVAYRLIDGYM